MEDVRGMDVSLLVPFLSHAFLSPPLHGFLSEVENGLPLSSH